MVQIEHGYLHRAWCAAGAILGRPGGSLRWWWQHDEALQPECSGPCDVSTTDTSAGPAPYFPSLDNHLPVSPIKLSNHASTVLYWPGLITCVLCSKYCPLFALRCATFITAWSLLIVAALPNVSPHNTADIWIWTSYFDKQMEFK